MAKTILMPRLSDTINEVVIAEWHKKVGDPVKKGDLLAEIETDKATMELESYIDGVILYLGTEKCGKLKVDDLMVIVGAVGEDISGLLGGGSPKQAPPAPPRQIPLPSVRRTGALKHRLLQKTSAPGAHQANTPSIGAADGRIKASPFAKKVAAEKGIDLTKVQGSGDGGRIIKMDIDNYYKDMT